MYSYFPNHLYGLTELIKMQQAPIRFGVIKTLDFLHNVYGETDNKFIKHFQASLELSERLTRRYRKLPFGIDKCLVNSISYEVKEQSLLEKDFCKLIHFKKENFKGQQPKLLIIAPIAGHHATLLRGTVIDSLPEFDVYITDWLDASNVPLSCGKFDLDDYIDYIIEFSEFLGSHLNLLAVCQPTVPVIAAVALMSEQKSKFLPKSMILMGGPIDARQSPTSVNNLAVSKSIEWFERMVITSVPINFPGYGRRVYPGFMQLAGFLSLAPERHYKAHIKLYDDIVKGDYDEIKRQKKFYDEYLSVMDMTAEFYLQTIKVVFQDYSLAKGTYVSKGRKVNLGAITKCGLLGIEGEHDDISGRGQTKEALNLCKNLPDKYKSYYLQEGVGHYGVFSGSRFKKFVVPVMRDFVKNLPK